MTTGYQRPRTKPRGKGPGVETNTAHGRNAMRQDTLIDPGESDVAELFELPGGELAPEEIEHEILAQQVDEFTCGSCFLVRHRSQLAREKNGVAYCRDCEG